MLNDSTCSLSRYSVMFAQLPALNAIKLFDIN